MKITHVTNVERLSWNLEKIYVKGDGFTGVLDITDPENQGKYSVGPIDGEELPEQKKKKATKGKTPKKA